MEKDCGPQAAFEDATASPLATVEAIASTLAQDASDRFSAELAPIQRGGGSRFDFKTGSGAVQVEELELSSGVDAHLETGAAATEARVNTAVEAIYDAAIDPSAWPRALAEVANCFEDVGSILQWNKDDGTFGVIASESLATALRDYQEHWSGHDFKAELAIKNGLFFSGEPVTDRHIAPVDAHYLDHPFNTNFLAKHGLGWFGSVAVSPDPRVGVVLSVQRSFAKPQFSESELRLVGLIGRHVEKSLRLSIRLLDAELAGLGLGKALALIGIGVFALDSMSRVTFCNPVGSGLLGEIFEIADDRLQTSATNQRSAFDGLLTRTIRNEAADSIAGLKPLLFESAKSRRRFVTYLLPIGKAASATDHFITRTRAIVLAIEQKSSEPPDPAVVRDVLDLTLGEAKVAALVGSGFAPRAAASRLGISEDTARNVLKRVFIKVGVSRQSELVALLGRIVLR
jgi:DNA-binding CsgD family transcriptional regulator